MSATATERKPRVTFTIGMKVPVYDVIAEAARVRSDRMGREVSRNEFIVTAAEREAVRELKGTLGALRAGRRGARLARTG